jgi:nucleoside 2-deoxyribosyltransferase
VNGLYVYLGGPINGCTDEEANGWRNEAKERLAALGHRSIDPMDRDYRGREMEPGIAAEIVELDKLDIEGSDVLIMNCPRPSVGTSMEIMYGWWRRKRVLTVIPEGSVPSPWLVYHSSELFHSVADAIDAL